MTWAVAVAPIGDSIDGALALARSGQAAEMRRDLSGALARYEEARALLADRDPTPLLANLLRWSGSVLRDMGALDDADLLYADSFDVAERTGAIAAKASALNCRAVIAQRRGALDEATTQYRQAARLAAEAGEIRLVGMIEQNLGVLANIRGSLAEAMRRYRAALRAFQEVADDEASSWVLNNLGMVLTDMGRARRAERCFVRALEIARSRRDRPMTGVFQANYAECLIALRRWDEATVALLSALAIAKQGDERAREGEALKFLGVLEREHGSADAAGEHLDAALRIARGVRDALLEAEVLVERGELLARGGHRARAMADWTLAMQGFVALHAVRDAERTRVRIEGMEGQPPVPQADGGSSPA